MSVQISQGKLTQSMVSFIGEFPDDMWKIVLQFAIVDDYKPENYVQDKFDTDWDRYYTCFEKGVWRRILLRVDEKSEYGRDCISINPCPDYFMYLHKIRVTGVLIPVRYKNAFGSTVPLKFIKETSEYLHFEIIESFLQINEKIRIYYRTRRSGDWSGIRLEVRRHKSLTRPYEGCGGGTGNPQITFW